MLLVGLSGGIATGKTTVSEMLQQRGIEVLDCDVIARQVLEKASAAAFMAVKLSFLIVDMSR